VPPKLEQAEGKNSCQTRKRVRARLQSCRKHPEIRRALAPGDAFRATPDSRLSPLLLKPLIEQLETVVKYTKCQMGKGDTATSREANCFALILSSRQSEYAPKVIPHPDALHPSQPLDREAHEGSRQTRLHDRFPQRDSPTRYSREIRRTESTNLHRPDLLAESDVSRQKHGGRHKLSRANRLGNP